MLERLQNRLIIENEKFMNKQKFLFRAVSLYLFLLLASCNERGKIANNLHVNLSPSPQLQTDQKEKRWERIFFIEIGNRIEGTDILNLRDKEISPNSKEVRIWVGFDLYPLKGIILKQNDGSWVAEYLPPIKDTATNTRKTQLLREPKSGWKKLWEKLESLDIYTLPDSVDIGATNAYPDAKGAVVEIKTFDTYRTYMYGGLSTPKSQESKNVSEICKILSREFGVELL